MPGVSTHSRIFGGATPEDWHACMMGLAAEGLHHDSHEHSANCPRCAYIDAFMTTRIAERAAAQ